MGVESAPPPLFWRWPVNPELFRINRVKTKTMVYGLPDRLRSGTLPRIEEAVNAQEVFDSSSRIVRRFMRLEGENWDLEFDTREVSIWGSGLLDCHAVEEGVSFFLGQIRECVHCHFWADEVTVVASWPLEENPRRQKSAGQILYEKSSRLKPEHLQLLPAGDILGSGISLLGVTEDDEAMWSLEAGPVGDELVITLELTFSQPEPAGWPEDELVQVTSNIRRAYSMMEDEIKAFIDAVMP